MSRRSKGSAARLHTMRQNRSGARLSSGQQNRSGAHLPSGRSGSTMVEASLVLPLVILSILTCIMISVFFYESTLDQCRLHIAMRHAAMETDGHTRDLNSFAAEDPRIVLKHSGIFTVAAGKEKTIMRYQGILNHTPQTETDSSWYASDGASHVRHFTITKKLSEIR